MASCNERWRIVLAVAFACVFTARIAAASWTELAPGLDLGSFSLASQGEDGSARVTILRIDAHRWDLDLLTQREMNLPKALTAKQWCADHNLVAATNAGMFATDYVTHLGYLQRSGDRHNATINAYQSIAAFGPKREGLKPFRIFDLDTPGFDIDAIRADYSHLVQNLRLIKRPRENRWSDQPKRWSEAALGEDSEGRALMIFSRTPFTMYELNRRLLELDIDLLAAQHLEGGPEAQLFVDVGETRFEGFGSFETGFREDDTNPFSWPVPNVIGVREKGARH